MPIWVIGGANTALSTEGDMLEGVDVGDVQSSRGLEDSGVTIRLVWMECGELVSGVGVAVQQ